VRSGELVDTEVTAGNTATLTTVFILGETDQRVTQLYQRKTTARYEYSSN